MVTAPLCIYKIDLFLLSNLFIYLVYFDLNILLNRQKHEKGFHIFLFYLRKCHLRLFKIYFCSAVKD